MESFLRDHAEPVAHITEEWIREQIRSYDLEGELRTHLAFGSYQYAFKPTGASFYADFYEPTGRPDITRVQIDIRHFHVWRFDDEHTEILLSFDAYVEADIECERVDAPPTSSSYGEEHYREVREFRGRTLPCRAELEFEMVADLQGGGISIRGIESIFAF